MAIFSDRRRSHPGAVMPPDPYRQLIGRKGGHLSWFNTLDRTARTAKARAALEAKFLAEAGGDPVRAASLRKAFYADLAIKSAKVRRAKSGSS
jgi:hypothetical protein